MHSTPHQIQSSLRHQHGLVDGVVCVSQPQIDSIKSNLPGLPADRIRCLALPIDKPLAAHSHKPLAGRPLALGYCGRLSRELKRIDRLPILCDSLDKAGIDFSLEILGDGPHRAWLQSQFKPAHEVVFRGRLSGAEYWRTLSRWDLIVFVSDVEGMPVAMLEAMSCGVIPLFPRINSGGDDYARGVCDELLYEPDDFSQLATVLADLKSKPTTDIQSMRERCAQLALPHQRGDYFQQLRSFVGWLAEQPRISQDRFQPRPFFWTDYCPFGLLRRIRPSGLWQSSQPIRL